MKKVIAMLIVSAALSTNLSEGAIKVEQFSIGSTEDKVSFSWPRLVGDQPEEEKQVVKLNRKLAEEVQDAFEDSYKIFATGLPEDRYQFKSTYEISYHTDRYISVVQEFYVYTGGANGNIFHEDTTFDFVTQQKLEIEDLFLPGKDYKKILTEKVMAQIEKMGKKEAYQFFKKVDSDTKMYFSSEGLVLLFSPYEVAPRVEGTVRITIPWQELKNILKEEFRSL